MTDPRLDPEIAEMLEEMKDDIAAERPALSEETAVKAPSEKKSPWWRVFRQKRKEEVEVIVAPDEPELSEDFKSTNASTEDTEKRVSFWRKWRFFGKKRASSKLGEVVTNAESSTSTGPQSGGWKSRLRGWARREGHSGVPSNRLPIRVIIGYLPEVTARDAMDYAYGLAEKYFDQMGLAYGAVFEYGKGMVYEVHEGGVGKAFAPSIIEYFESLPPFNPSEVHKVVIRTATRSVEVQRTREGLVAIMLPESSEVEPTEWLKQTSTMSPLIDTRKGFVRMATILFGAGIFAMLASGIFFRLQPYAEATPVKKELSANDYPSAQWSKVQNVPENSYVKALKYENGRWLPLELATVESGSPTPGMPPELAPATNPPPTLEPNLAPAPTQQ